jgi:hypothetical protein
VRYLGYVNETQREDWWVRGHRCDGWTPMPAQPIEEADLRVLDRIDKRVIGVEA